MSICELAYRIGGMLTVHSPAKMNWSPLSNALLWPPQSVTIIYKDWRLKTSNCLTPQGHQGAKKTIFTACHSGKLKLAFTSPDVISTSPKNFLTSRIYFKVLLLFEFIKKHHFCQLGKLKTEFTSPIAKSTSPGPLDTTFFGCGTLFNGKLNNLYL